MITIAIAMLFITIVILVPPAFLKSILQLTYMSVSFAFLLIAVGIVNFALTWFAEKVLFAQMQILLEKDALWSKKSWGKNYRGKRYIVVERM